MSIEPSAASEIEIRAAVPAMKLSEIMSVVMALRTKADNDWYRVIYLHAALIGAMVFFAGQKTDFAFARLVVFAFYSFNVAVSFAALRESSEGLRHATSDLRSFPPHLGGAGVQKWLASHDYARALRLQLWVLTAAWLVVAYLLLAAMVVGRMA